MMPFYSSSLTTAGAILIPTLIWLLVFLSQDKHREPKSALLVTFVGGMTSYFALEAITSLGLFSFTSPILELFFFLLLTFLILFIMIELSQSILQTLDEPYDYIVYYTTAILGFGVMAHTFSSILPGSSLFSSLPLYLGSSSPLISSLIFSLCGCVFGSLFAYASVEKNIHISHILHILGWVGAAAIGGVFAIIIATPPNISTYASLVISWILFIAVYLLIHGVLQLGNMKSVAQKKKTIKK